MLTIRPLACQTVAALCREQHSHHYARDHHSKGRLRGACVGCKTPLLPALCTTSLARRQSNAGLQRHHSLPHSGRPCDPGPSLCPLNRSWLSGVLHGPSHLRLLSDLTQVAAVNDAKLKGQIDIEFSKAKLAAFSGPNAPMAAAVIISFPLHLILINLGCVETPSMAAATMNSFPLHLILINLLCWGFIRKKLHRGFW